MGRCDMIDLVCGDNRHILAMMETARAEGFRSILIEREPEYVEIARRRIDADRADRAARTEETKATP